MSDFLTLYPGIYTDREKPPVEKFIADNKAIENRGAIDIQALINSKVPKDFPGFETSFVVTEPMVRYNNAKYDSENPILNDAEYAKKLGHQNIMAYPTFAAHDDTFMKPYPPQAKDKLLVSQLNSSITCHKPIYPGDTVYLVSNARHMVDLTPPEGSAYRSIVIQSEGSIYNQKGEKVNDVIFRVTENIKNYKNGIGPKNPTFADIWEAPDWHRRPVHYYTDDDWEFIKSIWEKEKRQGADPLYWEDIKVGDEPSWTLDGPIEESVLPIAPWGMGLGGSRTMKKEIMNPAIFKSMIRSDKDGIYRLPNRASYIPQIPDDPATVHVPEQTNDEGVNTQNIHKATLTRSVLINYFGRDIAIRHINNWMGDHGWLYNICWGIMPPEAHAAHGKLVPENPQAHRFLEKVPKMKGKHVLTHGLSGDVAIVKSYICNKYVYDNQFFVVLVWWIETIDGYIWEEGSATVKLPLKKLK